MLASRHRFHGHTSLRFVYQHGQTVRASIGTLKYARNNRRTTYRVAVVVSKKVHKSAVARNRIRRRLYEVVRQYEITEPFDLVFTVFADTVATMPAEKLQAHVAELFRQAHIKS